MAAEIDAQIDEQIRRVGDALGLRPGFYARLLEEPTDWAFLIELQVLVEAALAQRLVEALDEQKAFDHLSRLTLDGKTGKIQLALSLGLIDAGSADALRALAACRNRFAHRIAHIGATLLKFGESLDKASKLDLARKTGALQAHDQDAQREAGFPGFGASLRHRLWLSTAIALARLVDAQAHARLVELQRDLGRTQTG